MLDLMEQTDPALETAPTDLYTVTCRATKPNGCWQLETWLHALQLGEPLPTLPLWLADDFSIPIELEASYEETCKVLRIP